MFYIKFSFFFYLFIFLSSWFAFYLHFMLNLMLAEHILVSEYNRVIVNKLYISMYVYVCERRLNFV